MAPEENVEARADAVNAESVVQGRVGLAVLKAPAVNGHSGHRGRNERRSA